MTDSRHRAADHVRAAIARGLGAAVNPAATGTAAVQARSSAAAPAAPHVLEAMARVSGAAAQQHPGPSSSGVASHVQAAVDVGRGGVAQPRAARPRSEMPATAQASPSFVSYSDLKSPTSPPPPPRWPVFSLQCGDGGDCSIRDLKTGRVRPAGDLYAGFVRVSPGGPVYVSPRPDVGLQGDSHPSIASVTPEERRGRGAIVAAGEVGFINSQIVGHNDKTGHYRTRRNYWQSGMPSDRYHSFTVDPHEWYQHPADETSKARSPHTGDDPSST